MQVSYRRLTEEQRLALREWRVRIVAAEFPDDPMNGLPTFDDLVKWSFVPLTSVDFGASYPITLVLFQPGCESVIQRLREQGERVFVICPSHPCHLDPAWLHLVVPRLQSTWDCLTQLAHLLLSPNFTTGLVGVDWQDVCSVLDLGGKASIVSIDASAGFSAINWDRELLPTIDNFSHVSSMLVSCFGGQDQLKMGNLTALMDAVNRHPFFIATNCFSIYSWPVLEACTVPVMLALLVSGAQGSKARLQHEDVPAIRLSESSLTHNHSSRLYSEKP